MSSNPTFLGTIRDVTGVSVSIEIDKDTPTGIAFIAGQGYRIGQVGSFVRIPIGYIDLFGIVSQVGASAVPERISVGIELTSRWMTVQMVGECLRSETFRRGISQYPTVGDEVHLATEHDLARIYGTPDGQQFVRVGRLAAAEAIPALIDVNRLVNRHCAIVGSTGSGKSTTVAGLLAALSDQNKYPSARIIVLDLHGEYATALKDRADIITVNPSPGEKELCVPYWAMTYDELLAVTLGNLDDSGRGAVLEKIVSLKSDALKKDREFRGVNADNLTVDTPIPFSIHKMWYDLHCEMSATFRGGDGTPQTRESWALAEDDKGNPIVGDAITVCPPKFLPAKSVAGQEKIRLSQSRLNIGRQLEALASKLRDPRYDFLFRPGPWCPNTDGVVSADLDALIEGWVGGKKPISILDLSGVPTSITKSIIGTLVRIVYDALFWARNLSEGARERPVLFILEEAHSYLGRDDNSPAAQVVRRIAKEGRKYGIGAVIVSQRPSELDSSILSQCGTIVALRLSNSTDRSHVTGAVADSFEGLLNMLPGLRTGEAIIVGEAVNVPARVLIDSPPHDRRPNSEDPLICNNGPGGWTRRKEPSVYTDVVATWRSQKPKSPRAKEVKELNWYPVTSTDIAAIAYDETSQTLGIEFIKSGTYEYFDFPASLFDQFLDADSKGKFFRAFIKGQFRYAKVA